MKTKLILLPLLGLAAVLSGCTTADPTASVPQNDPRQGASIGNRTSYSQAELQKRGQPTLGGALEAQDASIRTSGSR